MKIEKFNESNINDPLRELFDKKLSINKEINDMNSLIKEFLILNNLLPDELNQRIKKGYSGFSIDFEFLILGQFYVDFTWNDDTEYESIELEGDRYDDLLRFIKHPNIYRNAKKYNL